MKPQMTILAALLGLALGVAADEKPAPVSVPPAAPEAKAPDKKVEPAKPKIVFADGPYTEASLMALAPAPRRRGALESPKGIAGLRSPDARFGIMELFGRQLPFVVDSATTKPDSGLTVLRLCWKGTDRLAEAQEMPLTSLTKEGDVFRCLFHAGFRGPRGAVCLYGAVFWVLPALPGRPTQASLITYDVLTIRSAEIDFNGVRHWVAMVDANGNGVFNDPGFRQADGSLAGGDLVAVDLGDGHFSKSEQLEIQSPDGFFRIDGKLYVLSPEATGETLKVTLTDCPLGGLVQKAPPGWRVVSRVLSAKGVSLVDSSKGREMVAAGNWQLLARRIQIEEGGAWVVAVVPPPPPAPDPAAAPSSVPASGPQAAVGALMVAGGKDTVLECPLELRCQLVAMPSKILSRQYELMPRFFTADGLLVTDMRDSRGLPPRIGVNIAGSGKYQEHREFQWRQGTLLPLIWDASLTLKGKVTLTVEMEAKPFDVKPEPLDLKLEK